MSETETPATPPPPAAPAAPAPRPRRAAYIERFSIGTTVFIQIAIAFVLVLMVNYISFWRYLKVGRTIVPTAKRWDFSRDQRFALSNLTKNVLSHLQERTQAIVFFPQAQMLSEDVGALLQEYEFASHGKFTAEFVNPYQNLARARELADKYKFGSSDNIVILDYKGKSKFVNAEDMAEMDAPADPDQPRTVRAFKGEEAITSALMEISEEKQNKLYLLSGHGEPDYASPEIAGLRVYVERQNIKTEPLNLNNVESVPADATGVMMIGGKGDLSEREIKLLGDYWSEKKGRLFILLNPVAKTPRLDDWLTSQGIRPRNDRVLKTMLVRQPDENNQLVTRSGVLTTASGSFQAAGVEVTKDVVGVDIQLLGASESLALDNTLAHIGGTRLIPLLESGSGFWGETEFDMSSGKIIYFDDKKDHPGPLTLAAAVELGGLADARVKVETARMIVVGNSGFVSDDGLQTSGVGLDFTLNGLNWIFNREEMAGIPPKPKNALKLNIEDSKLSALGRMVILGVPSLIGLLGLAVFLQRRA